MEKILLFAGTTEGRKLARYLAEKGIEMIVSTATEYGGSLIPEEKTVKVYSKKLDQSAMEQMVKKEKISLIIDATHPFAVEVSENIQNTCKSTKTEYLRLVRDDEKTKGDVLEVDSVRMAVDYLQETEGNILVTTGAKELKEYTRLNDYKKRIYARVLPLPDSIHTACELGIEGSHLIGMQGPFSQEMNLAMLKAVQAQFLITKESGTQGGLEEKISAAKEAGAVSIVVRRPAQAKGYSFLELVGMLEKRYGWYDRQRIAIIGMGMGGNLSFTVQARKELEESQAVIGSGRMLEIARREGIETEMAALCRPEEVLSWIRKHPWLSRIALLFSGDIGCHSGAKQLYPMLEKEERIEKISCISGIASPAYLMNCLHKTWDDLNIVSLHGKKASIISEVQNHEKTFFFLGGPEDVSGACELFCQYGMNDITVTVGEKLSYPQEQIVTGTPKQFVGQKTDPLAVLLVENPSFRERAAVPGIQDDEWIRTDVPMTKSEIRTVCLSKLQLKKDSVVYDIGAGTGSVAIEAALLAQKGMVYAIEKNPEAAELIRKNQLKFKTDNLQIIEGCAPDGMKGLPAPECAFIGGSAGKLGQIIACLKEKNPEVRIVLTAISLETLAEALSGAEQYGAKEPEILQISVNRAKRAGNYHMMIGQNPVYVITL